MAIVGCCIFFVGIFAEEKIAPSFTESGLSAEEYNLVYDEPFVAPPWADTAATLGGVLLAIGGIGYFMIPARKG